MIAMKIELELHKDGDLLLLNSQDMYEYIGESSESDVMFAYYIDKWCQYLNYPLLHNDEMMFGDADLARLEGWINGYNYAKKIDARWEKGVVVFRYGKHSITLNKPFRI